MKKILLLAFLLVASFQAAARAENQFGIFLGAGAGFANNLQFIDRLNALEKVHKENPVLTNPSVEEQEPLAYGGLSIEGRYYMDSLVFGLGLGYYDLVDGTRRVTGTNSGDNYVYNDTIDMVMFNIALSVYYDIKFDNGNYLLLGGGPLINRGNYHETVTLDVNGARVPGAGYDKEFNKMAIGWQMGIEYNFTFGMVNLSLGAVSRFADIYNYQIEYTSTVDNRASGGFTGCYLYAAAGIMI